MIEIDPRRRNARRVMRAVGAVAVAGGALVVMAESASAWSLPWVCSGASAANVCLDGYTNDPYVHAHVGIDVHMSAPEAQRIIAQPGTAFTAALYGADGGGSQYLAPLPLTYEAAGSSAISAEFNGDVLRSVLNEDNAWWEWPCDKDDVFARVSLYDAQSRVTRTFDSPQWHICF